MLCNITGKMSRSFGVLHHLGRLKNKRENNISYSFLPWSSFVPINVSGRIPMVCRAANIKNYECAERGFQKQ